MNSSGKMTRSFLQRHLKVLSNDVLVFTPLSDASKVAFVDKKEEEKRVVASSSLWRRRPFLPLAPLTIEE